MRTRPFHPFCSCIQRCFRAADGANIINEDIDRLRITVHGIENIKAEGGTKLNIMREFQEDFDEMELMLKMAQAERAKVRRGVKNSLDSIE